MNIPTLATLFETLSLSDRAAIAVAHAIDERAVASLQYEGDAWRRVVARLPRPTQAIVARIRRSGGTLAASQLETLAGPLRTNLETISPRAFLTIHHPLTPLEQLFVCGVVWPITASHGARYWCIPAEIEQAFDPIPPLFESAPPQPIVLSRAVPVLDEIMVAAACAAIDGRLTLQQHGRISQVVLNRLHQPELSLVMLQWLTSCWMAAGVFRVDANELVPTQRLLEWLAMPPYERIQETMRGWLQAAWHEWDLGQSKKRPPALDVRYARRTFVHSVLSHLPEEWCVWQDIREALRMAWPDVIRPANQQGKWQPPSGWPTNWMHEDAVLIEHMLRGPACWLGIVEWDEHDVLVRRTALGGWVAGVNPPPPIEEPRPATLESDGSIVVVDTTNYYARVQIHRIADWNDAVTAHISPERVRKAIAAGMSSATYLEIVQSVIGQPVPAAHATRIRAWATDVAHVSVQSSVLIRAHSADVMIDIMHDRQVAMPSFQQLNDTTIGLSPDDAGPVVRRLRSAGYMVDIQGLHATQFDDAELAVLEQMLRTYPNPRDEMRQLLQKLSQLRRKGK